MELFLIIFVLFIACGIMFHLLWFKKDIPKHQPHTKPALLTPADRPGTGWYNAWLMERPLNEEYKINHVVRCNK